MEHEHEHRHPEGPVFEWVYAASMLPCRGRMARAVAGLAELSAGDVVVDVGCGPGTAVRRARRAGATRAFGIDPSPQMLQVARWLTALRRVDGVDFLEGSAENLPLEPACASVVWAIQSVHHWEDRDQGFKEAFRVLAPGGRLVVAERAVLPGAHGHAAHGLTAGDADEVVRVLAQTGFSDVTTRSVRAGRLNLVVVTASAPHS